MDFSIDLNLPYWKWEFLHFKIYGIWKTAFEIAFKTNGIFNWISLDFGFPIDLMKMRISNIRIEWREMRIYEWRNENGIFWECLCEAFAYVT